MDAEEMEDSKFSLVNDKSSSSTSRAKEGVKEISVLVPTYMERENLDTLVELVQESLSQRNFEIIFIDDNSPDGTVEKIRDLSKKFDNLKLMVRDRKMGLGSAYKDGFKVSSGKIIVEMDADLSHNPAELPKIVRALEHFDIAVGSRYVEDGKILGWKWHRKLSSRGANLIARVVLGLKVKDSTSGFRAYERSAFKQVVSASKFNGFEFQVEVLYMAKKLGLKVTEVPITFVDRKRGRSKFNFKEIINFAKAVFKMRTIHLFRE